MKFEHLIQVEVPYYGKMTPLCLVASVHEDHPGLFRIVVLDPCHYEVVIATVQAVADRLDAPCRVYRTVPRRVFEFLVSD